MKSLMMTVGCLAAGAVMAQTYRPARLAPSPYADTEASTNHAVNLDLTSIKSYCLTIDFYGTPSNNVFAALGHDADGDGQLGFDEVGLEVGWDCGEAFARCCDGAVAPEVEGPDTNGISRISLFVPIKARKSNPRWLYDRTWNLMNVTVRGVDGPEEHVSFKTTQMGCVILIR